MEERKIQPIDEKLRKQVVELIKQQWGSPKIVSRGNIHSIDQLPGFVALEDNVIIGMLTYCLTSNQCEIVSLDSFDENRGIGSQLIKEIERVALEMKFKRIWLITTNDNIRAIKFYQKRGFELVALHKNAITYARKLKPEIPLTGYEGIPIQHELEFEKKLKD